MLPSSKLDAAIGSVIGKVDRAYADLSTLQGRWHLLKAELEWRTLDARAERWKLVNRGAAVLTYLLILGLYFKS